MTRRLTLYGRRDCYLCEAMKGIVAKAASSVPLEVVEIDVDSDPALQERFGSEVPVLFIDGRKAFKYRVNLKKLKQKLQR